MPKAITPSHAKWVARLMQRAVKAATSSTKHTARPDSNANEQIVPEFASSKCPSPQLDLDAWCLQGTERLLVDFTIRHPLAGRYEMCGDAARAAEKEKLVHYPARAGLTVVPAAMETYGRHGESMRRLLATLADRARQRDLSFGHAPGRWLKKWRAQLSHAMATLVGRAVQSSETAPRSL